MSYLGLELYVHDESRRLAAECDRTAMQRRAHNAAARKPATPRALLFHTGNRLIAIGERLRAIAAVPLPD